ncbi:unnamed protein product [Brachionus calyciflorus]|uniref:FLYWCH-type domain-containing protein n=1 Tax=Brachionus calyciflorus TaxID=104777 RepID=A0A814JFZ7_9BILA|nr:unnamed protein product [Brachionus calyciflorus]
MDIEMAFDTPFIRTETSHGTPVTVISKFIYVYKRENKYKTVYCRCKRQDCKAFVTTFDDLECLKGIKHKDDSISNIEYNSFLAEKRIIERSLTQSSSVPKILDEEIGFLIGVVLIMSWPLVLLIRKDVILNKKLIEEQSVYTVMEILSSRMMGYSGPERKAIDLQKDGDYENLLDSFCILEGRMKIKSKTHISKPKISSTSKSVD